MKIKCCNKDNQNHHIPTIKYFTTFNLKKTLISTLINIINKEYAHIHLDQIKENQDDEDTKTEWNDDNDDHNDNDNKTIINAYLNEYTCYLETFLSSYPCLNQFAAQRMLQNGYNIKEIVNMNINELNTAFPFLFYQQSLKFVQYSQTEYEPEQDYDEFEETLENEENEENEQDAVSDVFETSSISVKDETENVVEQLRETEREREMGPYQSYSRQRDDASDYNANDLDETGSGVSLSMSDFEDYQDDNMDDFDDKIDSLPLRYQRQYGQMPRNEMEEREYNIRQARLSTNRNTQRLPQPILNRQSFTD